MDPVARTTEDRCVILASGKVSVVSTRFHGFRSTHVLPWVKPVVPRAPMCEAGDPTRFDQANGAWMRFHGDAQCLHALE